MVDARSKNNEQIVSVNTGSSQTVVQATTNQYMLLDQLAKEHVQNAKEYSELASNSANNAFASAESAEKSYNETQQLVEYLTNNAPTIETVETAEGVTITTTDLQGTNTVTLLHGDKGEQGIQGIQGEQGIQGIQGVQGERGADGKDGADGFSPTASVKKVGNTTTLTVTDKNGTTTANILDGAGTVTDVQQNGVSVLKDGIANIITSESSGGGYHPPLLHSFWSDHILHRVDSLRADTFSWQSGKVYEAVYDELVSEYNDESSIEETKGGITFKRTPKGYIIADGTQENAILDRYNTYGIAWIYILDKDNTQFKLPRTKFGFEGLRDSVGNDIQAGLPNITGKVRFRSSVTNQQDSTEGNALYITAGTESASNSANASGSSAAGDALCVDASLFNPIYGNSDTVQPPATQMYLYFYVGNYTQTAIEQTAGINTELFNNKADKTEIDGEWVYPESIPSLVAEMNLNSSTDLELDLTETLPKDNNIYECILSSGCYTGSTSGNYINIAVNASAMPSDRFINICGTQTRVSNQAVATVGSTTIIIGVDRKLIVRRTTNFNGNLQYIYVIAYRKVR